MTTFAQRHRQKTMTELAAQDAKKQKTPTMAGRSVHDLMLAQLQTHVASLKKVQSIKARNVKKREFLVEYETYIETVLEQQPGAQDDVLMQVMVWSLDCGLYEQAWAIGEYALMADLDLPALFDRTLANWIVEDFAEAAIKATDLNVDAPALSILLAIEAATGKTDTSEGYDMPDQARAKLHKAIGLHLEAEGDDASLKAALGHYIKACELHDKCGVKSRRDKLLKQFPPEPDNGGKGSDTDKSGE